MFGKKLVLRTFMDTKLILVFSLNGVDVKSLASEILSPDKDIDTVLKEIGIENPKGLKEFKIGVLRSIFKNNLPDITEKDWFRKYLKLFMILYYGSVYTMLKKTLEDGVPNYKLYLKITIKELMRLLIKQHLTDIKEGDKLYDLLTNNLVNFLDVKTNQ